MVPDCDQTVTNDGQKRPITTTIRGGGWFPACEIFYG